MHSSYHKEFLFALVLIVLSVLLVNPHGFLMPGPLLMVIIVAVTLSFFIFSLFIWRQSSNDERDMYHNLLASRVSFLAGSSILLIAIIFQSVTASHEVDVWLVIALTVTILARIITLSYSQINH